MNEAKNNEMTIAKPIANKVPTEKAILPNLVRVMAARTGM